MILKNIITQKEKGTLVHLSRATNNPSKSRRSMQYLRGLRKVSDFFFCKNLMDFNEERLHEVTLKPHTHA